MRLTLVYSNYAVAAFYDGSPVGITTVSGSDNTAHNLDPASFRDSRYVVGAVNNNDGRGAVYWEEVQARRVAELESTAAAPDGGSGGSTLVQLGDGNAANTWRNPVGTRYNKFRSQVLYRAPQIGQSGLITQLQVRVAAPPAITLSGYTIRMQHSSLNDLSTSFVNSGWKTNYQANTTIPAGFNGWYPFNLSSNFYYNGTNNLLVDFIVNNSSRDDSPQAACTYTVGSGTQGTYGGANSGDPFAWTSYSGLSGKYTGSRYCDIRLAISNDQPASLGANLSFESGPRGYLTNVPSWQVEGSELSGFIKGSPVYHGTNSLKLWKDGGTGDQHLYQYFETQVTNQYTLSGYILSQSTEPFVGADAYGALLLEWYGAGGLLQSCNSAHFTPTNTYNIWTYYEVAAVPPANTTSGRIVCALFSSPDQNGSLYFDRLALAYGPAPAPTGAVPVTRSTIVADEFNDNQLSNIWAISWGGGPDADVRETNGTFLVKPGTATNQSTGCATPASWNNTSCWYVFSATLSTVQLDSTKSGNDIALLLGICSAPDNPWWVSSSVGLWGYYDQDIDQVWWELLIKSNAPASLGTARFNCTMEGVSRYMDGTNTLRVSIALGLNRYDVRFNDARGLPVPYSLNGGSPRGNHDLGSSLDSAYWYVGAQADITNRGRVFWDRTGVWTDLAPTSSLISAAQVSLDGSGIVCITNRVCDPNGDSCRLQVQASTNGGSSWFNAWGAAVASAYGATLASTQTVVQVVSIQTTNEDYGLTATNPVAFSWDTLNAFAGGSLAGRSVTGVLVRVAADDGDVGTDWATSFVFAVDNESPSAAAAAVLVEGGAAYTFNTDLSASWSGFTDALAGVAGYYYDLQNHGGTTVGTWTVAATGWLAGATGDALNPVHVWAADAYGNVGASASGSIIVLTSAGDYDADGLANSDEQPNGADPLDPDSDDDEMPDGWEVAHALIPTNAVDGTADPDEDRYNNRLEFYFDTNPTNADSHVDFRAAQPGGREFLVQWQSSTGRTYRLYSSDNAVNDPWQPVSDFENAVGVGGVMAYTGSQVSASMRFYRLGARIR